jgi:ATP-dependent DNA helicase RecG
MEHTPDMDDSAQEIAAEPLNFVAPPAVAHLRALAARNNPGLALPDDDLGALCALGLASGGKLILAGLLLAGSEQALRQALPGYGWVYRYAPFDGKVTETQQGSGAVLGAVECLIRLIQHHSPVFVTHRKEQSVEIHAYPIIALQQALLNAFGHQDLRSGQPIQVLQTTDHVQITNPGRLPDGAAPENILHTPCQARNRRLMQVLSLLGLAGLPVPGIEQIVWTMLAAGKEPPVFQQNDRAVRITLSGWAGFEAWPAFVQEETDLGRALNVDHLLLLHHLLLNVDVDGESAALICTIDEAEAHRLLTQMTEWGYLRHHYAQRDEFWALQPVMFERVSSKWALIRQRQLYYADLKGRFVNILAQRAGTPNPYIVNQEISKRLRIRSGQVRRFMDDVMGAYPEVVAVGKKRGTKYRLG